MFFFTFGHAHGASKALESLIQDLCRVLGGTLVNKGKDHAFLSFDSAQTSPLRQTLKGFDLLKERLNDPETQCGLWLRPDQTVLSKSKVSRGVQIYWPHASHALKFNSVSQTLAASYSSAKTWPLAIQPVETQETGAHLYQEVLSIKAPGPEGTAGFVARLESQGGIEELDSQVLLRALSALKDDPDLRLGINVSRASLTGTIWQQALDTPASDQVFDRLYVELTETAHIPGLSLETLMRACDKIRSRGAHLVLDDLGQGATSLDELRSLQLEYVKLDRELITWLIESDLDYNLIADLKSLGDEYGWQLIGEGVEDSSTIDFLTGHGVSFVQGFAIQRPELSSI